jgi:hypothetical protein
MRVYKSNLQSIGLIIISIIIAVVVVIMGYGLDSPGSISIRGK